VVDIEYVPPVTTGTIQELDAASQQQLSAIHQQYLLSRSQHVLGDTVGVNFKNHRGVAATERLVTIADWGWRIIDGGFESWAGVSDNDRINTLPGSPGYRTITYFSGWTELHSGRQSDTLIQHPFSSMEISAQIERGRFNQEVTSSFTAYDSSGGSPFYAGAEAFFAHKNTRIAAGVAGIALVVFTGGLSAPFVVGGMTLGGTTITGTGLAGAGIFAASSYAVVRMGDDIEAAVNDRERSLLTQGLDQINGYISNDPKTLTNNLVVSTDLAMFVVEVSAGFGYVIRGKQVLQQTDNALRGGHVGAASISDKVDITGDFWGDVEDLTKALRNVNGQGSTELRRIADRFDALPNTVIFHDTPKKMLAYLRSRNYSVDDSAKAFTDIANSIHLCRSRGSSILRDFAHEGQHAVDFGVNGIFTKKGTRWYAKDIGSMTPEQVFRREMRGYRTAAWVDGVSHFATRDELVEHILRNYNAAEPSW
jgi:hypothetical protein